MSKFTDTFATIGMVLGLIILVPVGFVLMIAVLAAVMLAIASPVILIAWLVLEAVA